MASKVHGRESLKPSAPSAEWEMALVDALVKSELVASKSEARRQIEQGGIKVDDRPVTDVKAVVKIGKEGVVIQKGKRYFVRLVI